jgi:superfamily II DNA or RNA helicase
MDDKIIPAETAIKPRPYQQEALDALERGRLQGDKRQLVVLPTGSGKTIVWALDVKRVIGQQGGRGALFMAHRDELINQAVDKTRMVWPGANIGVAKAARNELGQDITVASVQTIMGPKRLDQLVSARPIDLFYIDEAHHAAAPSYKRVIDAVREANPNVTIVGLTATPVRSDATKLDTVFESVTYQKSMLDLIEQGYLSDIELQMVDLDINIDGIPVRRGDLKPADLREALTQEHILLSMVDTWKAKSTGRRTLAFTVDVQHAFQLCNAFKQRGVDARVVHGETPTEERRAIMADFQAGKFAVLVNCMILCLDAKTEILTDRGWTGMEEMSFDHNVANYDPENGDVTFEPPLDIVRRPRQPNERMVFLQTSHRSIRVTEGHKMLCRTNPGGRWHKKAAAELVGKAVEIPVSTIARPQPTENLWALDDGQFEIMLRELAHDYDEKCALRISKTKHDDPEMLPRMQAVAVCRGWQASLHSEKEESYLHLEKRLAHSTTEDCSLQFENDWHEETVWCVRTRTSNLITRRDGAVTLMGNTEGFDDTSFYDEELGEFAPPLDCILLARPTLSQGLYIQQVGRGTRPAPNKEKLLLLDFSYNSNRHHLVQLPHLFGLEEATKQKRDVEFQMPAPKEIKSILAAVREAREIDIHQPPPRAGFHWSDTEYGFALSLGAQRGFLLIREAAEKDKKGKYRVWHFSPVVEEGEKASWGSAYRRNCLTTDPLEWDWAFGLAEDSARALFEARKTGRKMSKDNLSEPIQSRLFEREEPWHNEEPTPAQLKILKRVGKTAKTRKQASDAITAIMVARVIRRMEPATKKQLWFLRSNGISCRDRITMGEASRLIQQFKKTTNDSDFAD